METRTQLFDHHLAQTTMYPFALEIVRADGIYLYDGSGKAYMDLISGIGVSNLGHNNPHIREAIHVQTDKHLHVMVYGEFIQESQVRAAQLLTSLLPPTLQTCYFVNSGTEANEAALKLAKRVTGRGNLVSFTGAYHGSTHGSLSVSGNETKKHAFQPLLPGITFLRFNEADDLHLIDQNTAAVIAETIQGDAGVRIPDQLYLQALRRRCDEVGALLILDEIQCGMGRSGSFFAFEQFGIVPDILTLGKALGGGMPVGCLVAARGLLEKFTHDPALGHISTFAGHPVICAAVAANLEIFIREKVVDRVFEKGQRIASALSVHPAVRQIRHRGLFMAIDLESEAVVQRVVELNLRKGLISFWFLSCPTSFRIAPPLTITMSEIDEACAIILESLDEATKAI